MKSLGSSDFHYPDPGKILVTAKEQLDYFFNVRNRFLDKIPEEDREDFFNFWKIIPIMFKTKKGEPFVPTPPQIYIMWSCFKEPEKGKRLLIVSCTRLGKTEGVCIATLFAAIATQLDIWYISATKEAGVTPFTYFLKHIKDNKNTLSSFKLPRDVETGKIMSAKDAIAQLLDKKTKGSITLNVQAKKDLQSSIILKPAGDTTGMGGDIIIIDETQRISNMKYNQVTRMALDAPEKYRIIELGNLFYYPGNDHFKKEIEDGNSEKIYIDYKEMAASVRYLKGRNMDEFIEREKITNDQFDQLYGLIPPEEFTEDEDGYMSILNDMEVEQAMNRSKDLSFMNVKGTKEKVVGIDLAFGGNDFNTATCWDGVKICWERKWKCNSENPNLENVQKIGSLIKEHPQIPHSHFVLDATGNPIIIELLKKDGFDVVGVTLQSKVFEKWLKRSELKDKHRMKYNNLRSWLFLNPNGVQKAIQSGGILTMSDAWKEFPKLKYRVKDGNTYEMQPKAKFRHKSKGKSPDEIDSFSLCFYPVERKKVYNRYNDRNFSDEPPRTIRL